jgi:hypothetical protein
MIRRLMELETVERRWREVFFVMLLEKKGDQWLLAPFGVVERWLWLRSFRTWTVLPRRGS